MGVVVFWFPFLVMFICTVLLGFKSTNHVCAHVFICLRFLFRSSAWSKFVFYCDMQGSIIHK